LRRREVVAAVVLGGPSLTATANGLDIAGTGATFPAKVYQQWAEQYQRDTGLKVGYAPTGSSAGVRQIVARQVDFGATDVPLGADELARQSLFQFPTLVGGIVPFVNLPGVANGALRLSGDVLAAIFGGRVARWNDRAIAALNPGLALPDLAIERVVRSDGSGTTTVFVEYLNRVSPATPLALASGRAQWPGATTGAEGSDKLVAAVKASRGAIGYVSSDYALRDKLTAVSLRNQRGEWVAPTLEGLAAAIQGAGLFKDGLEAAPLIDVDGPRAWPIVTATYVVVPRVPGDLNRAGRALNFFYRSFLLGDKAVAGTGFAPLPSRTQARIVSLLAGFRMPDGRPLPVLSRAADRLVVSAR